MDTMRESRGTHERLANRHGDHGEIPIEWDYRTLRVREALPDEVDEWPKARGVRP